MGILGIDLGGTNIRGAIVSDKIINNIFSVPIDKSKGGNDVLKQFIDFIHQFDSHAFTSISVGVPSYVDTELGIIYDTINLPGWQEVHLKEILETEFGKPVYINNDANCFTLGEKFYGSGQLFNTLVGITLGTGVGAGIVIHNQLFEGNNCGAGEIGALPYLTKDYEYYCSQQFFSDFNKVSALEAFNLSEQGDAEALKIFNDYGHHLGELIKLVLLTYDPESIILGGSIAKAWKYFNASMFTSIKNSPFSRYLQNLDLKVSQLENAGIYGAAHLPLMKGKIQQQFKML